MPAELATTLAPASDEDRLLQAEALVRAFCGWHIAPTRQDTATVSLRDGVAVLPTLHLVSVDEVVASDGTVLDPATYVATEVGLLRRALILSRGFTYEPACMWNGDLTVTFTHGYAQPPADVTAAVVALAQQAKAYTPGLASKTTGPFTETYVGVDAVGQQRTVLDHYRLPARP